MRRVVPLLVVAALLVVSGSASAQWSLGIRFVGTGNYFPYMPAMSEGGSGLPLTDTGIYAYKELAVGYRANNLCFESFTGNVHIKHFRQS